VNDGYRILVDDEKPATTGDIAAYWKRQAGARARERDYLPPDVLPVLVYNGATLVTHQTESGGPDYDVIFKIGLKGYMTRPTAALNSA